MQTLKCILLMMQSVLGGKCGMALDCKNHEESKGSITEQFKIDGTVMNGHERVFVCLHALLMNAAQYHTQITFEHLYSLGTL
ncbi:hypothetical protein C0J50_21870 [Silurus asotus]|uniref:Secreted protein n=1 Tax=Silurus asotus TaxID=30991 RepID=A0AAD5ALS0_SILAS|nr:hypothetical protein C0J50_21870 [Silurus asotus]